MLKSKKNKRILLFFLKLALFACVLYFFYLQLKKVNLGEMREIRIVSYFFFISAVLLLSLNLAMEWLKWKNTLKALRLRTKPGIELRSFFAGILSGFLTPNLLGNFIGRIFYFERRERIPLTYLTLVSNAAQFVASVFFGLLSILFIDLNEDLLEKTDTLVRIIVLVLLGLIFLCYYNIFGISRLLFASRRWMQRISWLLQLKKMYLTKQLVLSLARHAVFSLQYYLLLLSFGFQGDIKTLFYIWQLFFISTIIPSLWLGKLFIRESVAIWILGSVSGQTEIVLLSSIVLWLVNQGLPALVGVPFFKLSHRSHA